MGFKHPMLCDNVTFAPGVRGNWRVHAKGQVFLVASGRGWYQEEGSLTRVLVLGNDAEFIGGEVIKIDGGYRLS